MIFLEEPRAAVDLMGKAGEAYTANRAARPEPSELWVAPMQLYPGFFERAHQCYTMLQDRMEMPFALSVSCPAMSMRHLWTRKHCRRDHARGFGSVLWGV